MDDLSAAIKNVHGKDCDLFLYSGWVFNEQVDKCISFLVERRKRNKLAMVLTTPGGDPHSAYRLMRLMQGLYSSIEFWITGPCKSSGTLMVIGAQEVKFGIFGELGPLDIQVAKKNDLLTLSSGLDTFQALAVLRTQAFAAFEEYMLAILDRGKGSISTQMSCEIATNLVNGLFQPMAAQLDPEKFGEMERMMTIAKEYGTRLQRGNLKTGALSRLIQDYPSHGFVIDYRESKSIFKRISELSGDEVTILAALVEHPTVGAGVFYPTNDTILFDVSDLLPKDPGGANEAANTVRTSSRKNDTGKPRAPRPKGALPEGSIADRQRQN